jgi:LPS export ABC transporter protein LptC
MFAMRQNLFLVSLGSLLLLLSCSDLSEEPNPPATDKSKPDQEFRQAEIEVYDGDLLRAILKADHMEQYQKEHRIVMYDNVESLSFDSLGRIESIMFCDTAHYKSNKDDLFARGNVKVIAAEDPAYFGSGDKAIQALLEKPPFKLTTEALDYIEKTGKISTDLDVVFETTRDTLYGVGFTSNQNLSNWKIFKPVGVSYRQQEGE